MAATSHSTSDLYVPVNPVRFVTSTALFDGHDAAINIMRRILQAQGAEVIHLGHDRSVHQVVDAVIEEDAQGVAVSSYQGGHVDELVRRFRTDQQDKLRIAVLAVDPTRRRYGGALLGDRIRMNALDGDHVFFRSPATRGRRELPGGIEDIIVACKAAGYDLVMVETPGIGQGDAGVTELADVSLYVSQLERVRDFQARHAAEAPNALQALKDAARSGANVFAVLMDAARTCSLQQTTEALFEVGGQYRRNV